MYVCERELKDHHLKSELGVVFFYIHAYIRTYVHTLSSISLSLTLFLISFMSMDPKQLW